MKMDDCISKSKVVYSHVFQGNVHLPVRHQLCDHRYRFIYTGEEEISVRGVDTFSNVLLLKPR